MREASEERRTRDTRDRGNRACLSLLARLRLPEKPETITPVLQANCTLLSK